MKKYLIWLLVMVLSVSIAFMGISCKAAATTTAAASTEAAATEAAATEAAVEEATGVEEAKAHGEGVEASADFAAMLEAIKPGTEMQKAIDDAKKRAGETIIVMVSGDCAIDSLEPITRKFEEETGVKVTLNIVSWDVLYPQGPIAIATDEYSVDIIDTWDPWLDEYGPQGRYVDLSEYMAPEFDAILPQLRADMTVGDKQLAFPFLPTWELVFYNKEMVAEAGLDPEDPPRTLDEFTSWMEKLSLDTNNDGAIDRYGFLVDMTVDYGAPQFQYFYKAYGGKPAVIEGDTIKMTLNTPEMKAAFEHIKMLVDKGLLSTTALTGNQWDITSMYENEEVPLLMVWEMYTSFMSDEILDKTGFFAFPGVKEGTFAATNGHENLAIPITSEHKEAAMAYIKYCGSEEIMRLRTEWNGTSPAYANLWTDPDILAVMPHLTEVAKEIKFETPRTWPVYGSLDLIGAMMLELQLYILGEKTVDQALVDLQTKADKDFKIIPGIASRYETFLK
jgi:ABC-type glycerol-3-phosphate transport system substrate-binding protein